MIILSPTYLKLIRPSVVDVSRTRHVQGIWKLSPLRALGATLRQVSVWGADVVTWTMQGASHSSGRLS
jgi:hypothetical protein